MACRASCPWRTSGPDRQRRTCRVTSSRRGPGPPPPRPVAASCPSTSGSRPTSARCRDGRPRSRCRPGGETAGRHRGRAWTCAGRRARTAPVARTTYARRRVPAVVSVICALSLAVLQGFRLYQRHEPTAESHESERASGRQAGLVSQRPALTSGGADADSSARNG
jgi:hypothetical protein